MTHPSGEDGRQPLRSNGSLTFKYTTHAPGIPLQDLMQVAFFPHAGQDLVFVKFDADSNGQLRAASGFPDGMAGTLSITELGLFVTREGQAGEPFFVHSIEVKPQ